MASFSCGISGETCAHPFVTPSGGVYEKANIERWISENGTDPKTNRALSKAEIIEVKQAPGVRHHAPQAMTIPAIIKSLRDEWDATVIENAKMAKDVTLNAEEVAEKLYHHDAACRIIARLTAQMAETRANLAHFQRETSQAAEHPQSAHVEIAEEPEEKGITDAIMERLKQTGDKLTNQRKKRGKKPPPELVDSSTLNEFVPRNSFPGLHSASVPGITCLDVDWKTGNVATGGNDRSVVIFDRAAGEIIATCKGHQKAVSAVCVHGNLPVVLSASLDSSVRVWNYENPDQVQQRKFGIHRDQVTGLSLHPTQDYFLSTSKDKSWTFSDINSGVDLIRTFDEDAITCGQFHPDGLILGTGTTRAEVKIWDLKSSSKGAAASPFRGHSGPVEAIAFSENGYHLATASRGNEVKLWDLRKLKIFKTLTLSDSFRVRHLTFDSSGTYLSVAGNDVRIFKVKEWNEVARYSAHSDDVTCARWGPFASELVTSSIDRTVKVFSLEN